MDYIQGIAEQTEIFLYSLGFGFLLGILYDVFRTVRLIISNSKIFVFLMDLLYFLFCGFLAFFFMLVVDSGRVRLYVALGVTLGWLIYYFSFGAVALRVTDSVCKLFKSLISAILSPVRRAISYISEKTGKTALFCKKNIRKTDKKTKFILQKYKSIVYNLCSYIININFKDKRN